MLWWVLSAAIGSGDDIKSIADTHDEIIMALIALVATSITALVFVIRNGGKIKTMADDASTAATQAAAANAAVNNVGPGQHTLYNLVSAIRDDVDELKADQKEFTTHGWGSLPADLSTAPALTSTIRDMQRNHQEMREKLDVLIAELRDHVEWEMSQKYPPK